MSVHAPCTVEGCARNGGHKGMCNLHYQRNRVYGDPLHPGVKDRRPWSERLESKIAIGAPNDCWPWVGKAFNRFGYGSVCRPDDGHRSMGSHRAAWIHFRGPIPDGLHVLHRCDNPPCCNPNHLFLGTVLDNNADAVKKGRNTKGERHPKAKLTVDLVKEIRARHTPRGTGNFGITNLARAYNLSSSTVGAILHRRIWREVEA